jgi:hypothetical protein
MRKVDKEIISLNREYPFNPFNPIINMSEPGFMGLVGL